MTSKPLYTIISYFIAAVWIANGLLCKVLNLVPRHQQIVATILGNDYARPLTILIGLSEILVAIWIIGGYKSTVVTWLQIGSVMVMNVLELILAPELLLWGKFNIVFAMMFISLVYINQFYFKQKLSS